MYTIFILVQATFILRLTRKARNCHLCDTCMYKITAIIDGYQSYHHVTVVPPPLPCAVLYLILTASCVTLVPL